MNRRRKAEDRNFVVVYHTRASELYQGINSYKRGGSSNVSYLVQDMCDGVYEEQNIPRLQGLAE